ncbi:hypothetical protein ACNPQM_25985 [Streptomyces sp. NPDC056231]|uniref:hypothetical protein n=1 Tax=Streptomyces sp. NPDC056231 TaxID=3345755 RepID=UPI003AB0FC80
MRLPDVDTQALESLVATPVAAPSIHNSQPWRFRLDPAARAVEVRMVRERTLPLADPVRRAQLRSVGPPCSTCGWLPPI